MIKVAVATSDAGSGSIVPAFYRDAACLLIMDADSGSMLYTINRDGMDPFERSLFFAQKVVEYDCEAILCGELEVEPFAILAEENCVTRFMAAGLTAPESIQRMNDYELALLTDHIGGTGCSEPDPSRCEHNGCGDCDGCDEN